MCKGSNYNVIRYLKSDEGIVKKIGVQLNFDFIMGALKIIEHLELRAKLIELLQGIITMSGTVQGVYLLFKFVKLSNVAMPSYKLATWTCFKCMANTFLCSLSIKSLSAASSNICFKQVKLAL